MRFHEVSRSALATGRRAARMAGNKPPTKPMNTDNNKAVAINAGVTANPLELLDRVDAFEQRLLFRFFHLQMVRNQVRKDRRIFFNLFHPSREFRDSQILATCILMERGKHREHQLFDADGSV